MSKKLKKPVTKITLDCNNIVSLKIENKDYRDVLTISKSGKTFTIDVNDSLMEIPESTFYKLLNMLIDI